MILLNKKKAISVKFKEYVDENEIDIHNDIALDILEHLSYVDSVDDIEIEFLDDELQVVECDYCGEKILRKVGKKRKSQKYVNNNDEYPCTDDCCKKCLGRKNAITLWQKYGVANVFELEVMEKAEWEIPCSRPQQYLANLLNGKVNVRFAEIRGFVDILLEDEKIIIEYDGSGHFLGEYFGRYTYEEKLQQDYERDSILKSLGYKIIRIESKKDYLPSDEIILKQMNEIKKYFDESGKDFFKWVIPTSKKDKRYGKLRTIKEEDLCRQ